MIENLRVYSIISEYRRASPDRRLHGYMFVRACWYSYRRGEVVWLESTRPADVFQKETFSSTCHGAGRVLSRSGSRRKLDYDHVTSELADRVSVIYMS